jgi:hypothetical protein
MAVSGYGLPVMGFRVFTDKPETENTKPGTAVKYSGWQQNVIQLLYRVNRPPAQFNYPVNGLLLLLRQLLELEQLRLGEQRRQRIVECVANLCELRPVGGLVHDAIT